MTTDMLYNFPRAKFVDANGICGQVFHLETEINEAKAELHNPDIIPLAMEVMDVYHSAETALRILEEKYAVNISSLMQLVADKNDARGYYHG